MAAALTSPSSFPPALRKRRRPIAPRLVLGLLALAVVAGVWWAATQQSTVTRKAADISTLIPLVAPEPPPPPPEEVIKPQTPEEVPPAPADQPTPQTPTPQNAPAAPSAPGNAVAIDGPAQAGGDAFNIGSGGGGGRRGAGPAGSGFGGFNRAAYASYLEGEFRRALEAEKGLRTALLRAKIQVWIDAAGKVVRVEAGQTDKADLIRAALMGRSVRAPDPSLAMPVALGLDIRRAG